MTIAPFPPCIPTDTWPKGGVPQRARAALLRLSVGVTLTLGTFTQLANAEEPPVDGQPEESGAAVTADKAETGPQLPPPSTSWKLVAVGLGSTAVWYGAAYGIREGWRDAPGANDLRYPVVGPIMDLTKTGCPEGSPDCSTFELVLRTVLVSLDTLGQVGGLAIAFEGLSLPTEKAPRPKTASPAFSVVPVPWVTGGSTGLSLVGRF